MNPVVLIQILFITNATSCKGAASNQQYLTSTIMKLLLPLFTFLSYTTACIAQDFDYSFKESYKIAQPGELRLSTSDGNIEIVPSNGSDIEVYFITKKNGRFQRINKNELEKELTIEVVHEDHKLEISIRHDHWQLFAWDQYDVGLKVYAPMEMTTYLFTSDGNISISDFTGNQECKTSDGNIKISNIKGNILAKTSDGNIHITDINGSVHSRTSDGEISLKNINGNVELNTSDGNINLANVKGSVSAGTSDGNISFRNLEGALKATTSDGNVEGDIVVLRDHLMIRTSDGNINVTLPDQLGLDLTIKGESLSVPLKNFSGHSEEEFIQGQINGGGIPVNLSCDGRLVVSFR